MYSSIIFKSFFRFCDFKEHIKMFPLKIKCALENNITDY